MIGGGKNAFIGAVHRIAANMDGLIELVCGAFSSHPENARESGQMLFLPADRTYLNYEEMLEKESKLPEGVRMDFVAIVTFRAQHSSHREPKVADRSRNWDTNRVDPETGRVLAGRNSAPPAGRDCWREPGRKL